MDNIFFEFVETYWGDIVELFKAIKSWIEVLFAKSEDETVE